jgi:hypothetical protein
MVALDLAAGHSVAITADWIEAFSRYEGHDVKTKK